MSDSPTRAPRREEGSLALPLYGGDRRGDRRHCRRHPCAGGREGAQAAGHRFVSLIKMMISPVIFCTIVLGIGSIRQAAKVGKVGGLAMLYFIVMSTSP